MQTLCKMYLYIIYITHLYMYIIGIETTHTHSLIIDTVCDLFNVAPIGSCWLWVVVGSSHGSTVAVPF